MSVLSVVSAKGGVGKSTVAANIAVALHQLGHPVLAIDLDPQNGLSFHFSFEAGSTPGLAHAGSESLGGLIQATSSGVALLTYGQHDEARRQAFESRLSQNPRWLAESIEQLNLAEDTVVVLDTPPGPSVYMTQALNAASFALTVVLPDAGSYVTLPQMKALFDTYCIGRDGFVDYGILVNQIDQSRNLSRDVAAMLRASFGDKVVGRIHQDQAISEALAFGQSVLQYAPYSEGASDITACARWISERLSVAGVGR